MTRELRLTQASSVKPARVRWLWASRVPLSKVAILAGAAGQAKSLTTTFVAGHITRGTLPGDLVHTPSDVVMISAEDDPEDTIVPRLIATGADLSRVHFIDMREVIDGLPVPSTVSLPGDGSHLREAVDTLSARLVVIDPISGLLDENHSSWSTQHVRRALAPLVTLAQEYDCAVLCVMHPNKSAGTNALARIADSGAFTALARSVLFQGPDPADPQGERGSRKVLALPKSNLAGRGEHALALEIDTKIIDGEIEAPYIVIRGTSEATAADVLAASDDSSQLGEARAFLREELADGPKPATDTRKAAGDAGISDTTLRRARELECKRPTKQQGPRGQWVWELKVTSPPHGSHVEHLEHLPQPAQYNQGAQDDQGGNSTSNGHLPSVVLDADVYDFTKDAA